MLSSIVRKFSTINADVCVIGGGPGGYTAAIRASQRGLKTVCIDANKAIGGTCLNVGCIPSKILLNAAHMIHESKDFSKYGISISNLSIDINKLMDRKQSIIRGLNKGIEGLFKKNKVQYIKGYGSFKDKDTVEVEETKDKIRSKYYIIAAGSYASHLPGGVMKYDEKRVLSSTGALALRTIPKKMIVIGGGVIGLELGSVYRSLGSQVDVVEFADRIVPNLDSEISRTLQMILSKQQGMNFYLGNMVIKGQYINGGNSVEITAQEKNNKEKKKKFQADYVLISTGRKPNTSKLGLKNINVKTDKVGRILVNNNYQTVHKNIYAIGDCIPGIMLAHKAEEDAVKAVDHIAGYWEFDKNDVDLIPSVVYTNPEVASVGLSEDELKKRKIQYKKGKFPFAANSRARAVSENNGFVKVLCEKQTGKVLGVHIIGPSAGEMIHECAVAMKFGAKDCDIANVCHAHPTFSESIKEACLMSHFKAINI